MPALGVAQGGRSGGRRAGPIGPLGGANTTEKRDRVPAVPGSGAANEASHHTVRYSHASLLLEKGVDLATVSERLGHSSIATTAKIYAHAPRGKDFAAAQIWDDIKEQARAEKPAGVLLLT